MPFGHAWTLWQRLPPRYQLTARYSEEFQADIAVSSNNPENTPSPRLYPTPRAQSASARAQSASARDRVSANQNEHEHDDRENKLLDTFRRKNPLTASFPRRNSDYVSHYKTQRRVSSARRRLAEAPPQPAIHGPTGSHPGTRAQTAPAFPVTSAEFQEEQIRRRDIERYIENNNKLQHAREKSRGKPGVTREDVFNFDDSKSVRSVELQSETESIPKKYLVQETKDAIMYVDNGKVTYFKKSRHDLTALLKTQTLRAERGNCFLAEIRKDYLKHPKFSNKVPSGRIYKQSLTDPRVIASDRVNYNDRLERILQYYSDKESNRDITSPDRSRPTSARRSPIKGLSLTGAPSRPPSPDSSSPGRPDSPNDYIRMNKRSKLHNRQFYLRTPSQKHAYSTKELESCRCYMCRVELQLALVTGVPSDIALAATNQRTKHPQQPMIGNFDLLRNKSEGNEKVTKTDAVSQGTETKLATARVTFHQPEVTSVVTSEKPKEHTLTISCTLPEMTDAATSESGFDTARTSDIVSVDNYSETLA